MNGYPNNPVTTLKLTARDKEGPIQLCLAVQNQFAAAGQWLRGIFHCHVGQIADPSAVCGHYQQLGFNFLGSSDYNHVTIMPRQTGDLITLQGAEVYYPEQTDLLHVICTGLQQDVAPLNGTLKDVNRLVDETQAQGGLAMLAHPVWSDYTWPQLTTLSTSGLTGFEVSNRLCWRINGKGRADQVWHMLLNEGHHLAAIGADDANSWDEDVVGQTWTGVLATETTPQGILDGVRHHRTYASEGPKIEAIEFLEPGMVRVRCSPCSACHFMSRGFGARTIRSPQFAEQFELDLAEDGYRLKDWLCVCLEDGLGRRAWSSAIPLDVTVSAN